MEILFPHDKFLHGKILLLNPSSRPTISPLNAKISPDNVCTLPNNHYYM